MDEDIAEQGKASNGDCTDSGCGHLQCGTEDSQLLSEPPFIRKVFGDREVFFDVQGLKPGVPLDDLISETTELIAKIASAAIILWFSMNELVQELKGYKSYRQGDQNVR